MSDGILVFTFSPIQSFIAESRRLGDLFAGSRILVELSKSVAQVLGDRKKGRRLVYPANLSGDLPNKLVAVMPFDDCKSAAEESKRAFFNCWKLLSHRAHDSFQAKAGGQSIDHVWESIWSRQTQEDYFWEIYWAALPIDAQPYHEVYRKVEQLLNGIKRTRCFPAYMEEDEKDSLSGIRTALHTKGIDSRRYWTDVVARMRQTHLVLPAGRERLDSIGLIKRFTYFNHQDISFPSTSSVASSFFLDLIKKSAEASTALSQYGAILNKIGFPHSGKDPVWDFDGDLFYLETLTVERIEEDYGIQDVNLDLLQQGVQRLKDIYKIVKDKPSTYYAILMLDGDSMGEALHNCRTEEEHRKFSEALDAYSENAQAIMANEGHLCKPVYTGGDDVLLLSPLSQVIPLACKLAQEFKKSTNCSASAGIVVAHHRSPLSAALQSVRIAEKRAKSVSGKSAICARILKRSGEELEAFSKWDYLSRFSSWVGLFEKGEVSSRFPYQLLLETHILSQINGAALSAELKRLLNRHKSDKLENEEGVWEELSQWAADLDLVKGNEIPEGIISLGKWLSFARFVAVGGEE